MELAPGVHVVEHRTVEGKNGVLIGRERAAAIDCGSDSTDSVAQVALLAGRDRAATHLILTHGHPDHAFGATPFRGCEVIAHAQCRTVIERHLPIVATARGVAAASLATTLAWPTLALDGSATLDLGGISASLLPAPGHSADGLAIWLPEHGILFGGDSAVTAIVPAIAEGSSAALIATLGRLIALEATVLVPGHGQVVRGRDAVRAALRWSRTYLEAVRQHCAAGLARGDDGRHIVATASYDRFCGERFPIAYHDMERRHRAVVGRVLDEMGSP